MGPFVFYHANGKVESKGFVRNGNKSGLWERFDVWGGALAEKVYDPEPAGEHHLHTRPDHAGLSRWRDQAVLS
jgi:antitoxin component YwqK of YwqJK toxin-antitoxin module